MNLYIANKQFYKLVILCLLALPMLSYSQNGLIGNGFGFEDWSSVTSFADGAGSSRISILNPSGENTGNKWFRLVTNWDGDNSQWGPPDNDLAINESTIINDVVPSTNAYNIEVNDLSYNYVFKTRSGDNPPPNPEFIVFEIQGDIRELLTVTQSPFADDVFFGEDVTVTTNLDGALSTGQAVYLRYTSDGFITSTIVAMSGSGTTYTATIPAAVNTANANIQYYVFTSGDGLTIDSENADFFTINLNNGGSNYGYTSNGAYITQAGANNWSDSGSWRAGEVPPNDADVIIAHDLNLTDQRTASSVTIQNEASLNNTGILNIQNNGSITNSNATGTSIDGQVSFNGDGLVSGEVIFNNVILEGSSTGVNFNDQSTILGTLTIRPGGNVDFGSPIYGPNSTLIYDTGGTYDRTSEWSNAGIQGFPHHVIVQNSTTLDMGADNATIPAEITGNLNVDNGSTLDMNGSNAMQTDLIIGGNLLNNGIVNASNYAVVQDRSDIIVKGHFNNTSTGQVNLSTTFGNDIRLEGDFTNANGATINFNDRAIFFEGTNTQTLTATNNFEIPFLVIDKTGGEVVLAQDIIVTGTGGPALNMSSDQAVLNLNDHQLQIGSNTDTEFSMVDNSAIKGSTDSSIVFSSTNTTGSNLLRFSQNASSKENYLSEFEMEGTGTIGISDTLNILRRFTLNNGTFNSDTHLTFKSSDTLTAVIPEVTGGTISGDVRVERHFPLSGLQRSFRYISPSATTTTSIHANWQEGAETNNFIPNQFGTHITGSQGPVSTVDETTGFDRTETGNYSLFTWDETVQDWSPVKSTIDNPATVGTVENTLAVEDAFALMVRGDRTATLLSNTDEGDYPATIRTHGTIHTGNFSYSFNSPYTPATFNFVLVGNPYQSQVDMRDVFANAGTDGVYTFFVWVWDPGITDKGAYAVVDLSDGSNNVALPLSSEANQFLQPFQAVFVQVDDGNTPQVINFEENDKDNTTENQTAVFSEAINYNTNQSVEISLFNSQNDMLIDAIRFRFDNNYTNTVSQEDAVKFWNSGESLAIINNGSYLSIDKRNLPGVNDTIPLYLGNHQTNQYTLELDVQLEDGQHAQLYDVYLDQSYDLENGLNIYEFSVDASIPNSTDAFRFKLIFNPQTLSTATAATKHAFKIYPNPTEGELFLQASTPFIGLEAKIRCLDLTGREVLSIQLDRLQALQSLNLEGLSDGFYILKIQNTVQVVSFKIQIGF